MKTKTLFASNDPCAPFLARIRLLLTVGATIFSGCSGAESPPPSSPPPGVEYLPRSTLAYFGFDFTAVEKNLVQSQSAITEGLRRIEDQAADLVASLEGSQASDSLREAIRFLRQSRLGIALLRYREPRPGTTAPRPEILAAIRGPEGFTEFLKDRIEPLLKSGKAGSFEEGIDGTVTVRADAGAQGEMSFAYKVKGRDVLVGFPASVLEEIEKINAGAGNLQRLVEKSSYGVVAPALSCHQGLAAYFDISEILRSFPDMTKGFATTLDTGALLADDILCALSASLQEGIHARARLTARMRFAEELFRGVAPATRFRLEDMVPADAILAVHVKTDLSSRWPALRKSLLDIMAPRKGSVLDGDLQEFEQKSGASLDGLLASVNNEILVALLPAGESTLTHVAGFPCRGDDVKQAILRFAGHERVNVNRETMEGAELLVLNNGLCVALSGDLLLLAENRETARRLLTARKEKPLYRAVASRGLERPCHARCILGPAFDGRRLADLMPHAATRNRLKNARSAPVGPRAPIVLSCLWTEKALQVDFDRETALGEDVQALIDELSEALRSLKKKTEEQSARERLRPLEIKCVERMKELGRLAIIFADSGAGRYLPANQNGDFDGIQRLAEFFGPKEFNPQQLICPCSDLKPAAWSASGKLLLSDENCSYMMTYKRLLPSYPGDVPILLERFPHPDGRCHVLRLNFSTELVSPERIARLKGSPPSKP